MNGNSSRASHPSTASEPNELAGSTPRHTGRRAARAADVRARLLAAAETLVADRQSAAITARDIARAAGVSDGVLYNHFADKHELVLAALVARFERLVTAFQAEVAATPTARHGTTTSGDLDKRFGHLAGATFRLHAAALPMLANVLSEPALFQRFMVAMHRPPLGGHVFSDPVEELVRAEQAAGRAGDVEPRAMADLLVGSILLISLVDLLGGRPREQTEARLRDVVRTLVLGLARRPATP